MIVQFERSLRGPDVVTDDAGNRIQLDPSNPEHIEKLFEVQRWIAERLETATRVSFRRLLHDAAADGVFLNGRPVDLGRSER